MKKINLVCLFLLIALAQLHGQNKDATINDLLNRASYEYDKDAGAAIIYDLGETNFFQNDNGFYTKFTRKFRIKFFSDANLDFSEIKIPLYHNDRLYEEIEDFKATAYNLTNGIISTTQTDKKQLLEETYNKNYNNYKVAIAGVKAGSVMDVEYTITSPFLFQIQDWQFQYEIPVLYSEYITHMIPFYTYSYILKGTDKLDKFESNVETGLSESIGGVEFQKKIYHFVKTKIPAFYKDDYITSENDYLIALNFQLEEFRHLDGYVEKVMSTWPELTEELIKNEDRFGNYIRGCKKLAKEILEKNSFNTSDKQKYLEQLVRYVKNNFDWNGNYGYSSDLKASDLARMKKGNDAAINLLLVALLREAGFSTEPVMLSTRDHGKIYSKYPFLHYFNYTIALTNLDGKSYLSDATNKLTCFDQIPTRCINEIGLVVKKGEENWITISTNNLSNEMNSFTYQLNGSADSLKCSYSCKTTGYYALWAKTDYKEDSVKFIQEQINSAFAETLNSKIYEADTSKTFQFFATGLITPTKIDKYISFKPFLNCIETNNPFIKRERTYPVDFVFPRKRTFFAQISLPEGAKLAKQPESTSIDNSEYSLKYDVSFSGNSITVNAEYCLKNAVYKPTLYPGLKFFYENLIKYLNQNIEIEL